MKKYDQSIHPTMLQESKQTDYDRLLIKLRLNINSHQHPSCSQAALNVVETKRVSQNSFFNDRRLHF